MGREGSPPREVSRGLPKRPEVSKESPGGRTFAKNVRQTGCSSHCYTLHDLPSSIEGEKERERVGKEVRDGGMARRRS
eukprot:679497-Pyramimonas_sp.AAC.1